MSLKIWDDIGMFDREVALYEKLRDKNISISFVTYGNIYDLDYGKRLNGIEILCNHWNFPDWMYEKFLHRFHSKALKPCDLIKTNQMNGADVALRSAIHWGKPLICRMGYMWSEFVNYENGVATKILKVENKLFNSADRITVTTDEMNNNISDRIPNSKDKTLVIPNYVKTSGFKPNPEIKKEFDILFVGRLVPQKNIKALFIALHEIDAKTMIIGSGELKRELQLEFDDSSEKICWQSNVSNNELPLFMNRSSIFILPSLYEGHPKTLIEAMACGMPVIGANSPGIREIINHGINGYLCGTDPESIKSSIEELLSNPSLCESLGKNAREYAVKYFSLDRIVEMEYDLYKTVLDERKKH